MNNYFLFIQLSYSEFIDLFTYVLGGVIIVGSLILRIVEKNKRSFLRHDLTLLVIFTLFIIVIVSTRAFYIDRGFYIGTDTINYYRGFYLPGIRISSAPEFFNYFQTDILFELIGFLTFPFKSFTFFLTVIALFFNLGLLIFVRKFTNNGNDGSSFLLFVLFACSFSFLSLEINIIRNSIAFIFILFALYYFSCKYSKYAWLYLLLSYLAHGTSLIPIAAILSIFFFPKIKIKYFIILYVLAIGLSMAGFGLSSIPFLSQIQSDDFQKLSDMATYDYRVGFRIDFVLYNSLFLFLSFKFSDLKNKTDIFLIKYFVLTSVIFFLNFNIPFSDRIGLYSWIAIPLMLFSTIKNAFPAKHLYYSSLVGLFYYAISYHILPNI